MIQNDRIKRKWKNILGICLIIVWFMIFIGAALMERTPSEDFMYNLHLFWCIREAWATKSALDWYFIVGNVSLFIPLGVLLPLCFDQMRVWWQTILFGFMCSLVIEMIQLVFRLGLFEFDDIFNNTLGTLLGYGIFIFLMKLFRKEWQKNSTGIILSFFAWIVVLSILTVALCSGQPVFGMHCMQHQSGV